MNYSTAENLLKSFPDALEKGSICCTPLKWQHSGKTLEEFWRKPRDGTVHQRSVSENKHDESIIRKQKCGIFLFR